MRRVHEKRRERSGSVIQHNAAAPGGAAVERSDPSQAARAWNQDGRFILQVVG